jgi:hypothetical protein
MNFSTANVKHVAQWYINTFNKQIASKINEQVVVNL